MSKRLLEFIAAAVVVLAVIGLLKLASVTSRTPAPTASRAATLKTGWGEPDLQGIWTDEYDTALQRAPRYAGREFLTDTEIVQLNKQRASILGREYRDRNAEGKGTEQDVAGAYNSVFESHKRTGRRTSLVVEPPDGRIPPLTAGAQNRRAGYREFQAALLQAPERCTNKGASCPGGKCCRRQPQRAV